MFTNLYVQCGAGTTIIMDGIANNVYVLLKKISKFDRKKEDEFLK